MDILFKLNILSIIKNKRRLIINNLYKFITL